LSLGSRAAKDQKIQDLLNDTTITNVDAAEALGTSEASVRRYRRAVGFVADSSPAVVDDDSPRAHGPETTGTSDVREIYTGPLDEPITDVTGWAPVMRLLGIGDPENWVVVDDTVRMSTWQTSKRTEDGSRDIVNLYAYKARIARKTEDQRLGEDEIAEKLANMKTRGYRLTRRTPGSGLGPAVGWCHHQGDEQAGKDKNNGGLATLEEREFDVLERSLAAVKYHMKKGVNVQGILDNSAGDRIENIFGHYASQGRTTHTFRNQFSYAVESDIARTEAFAELGLPITKVYTPSNHGEMRTVQSAAPAASDSDNWDLIIAEDVKRVLDRSPLSDLITWEIPHDSWMTLVSFMGVNIGASHGHKADGKNLQRWALGQRDMFNFHEDFRMQIMLLGHKHHFHIEDVGGTVLIQSSTLDTGSRYFEAGMGNRSIGGALGFLVGEPYKTGFDALTFL